MKEGLKTTLEAFDMIFVPGGFYRFVKKEDKEQEEKFNIKPGLEEKIAGKVLVPVIETLKVAAYISAAYGAYLELFK